MNRIENLALSSNLAFFINSFLLSDCRSGTVNTDNTTTVSVIDSENPAMT